MDGSPVLDIKPYVPFCDSVTGATAPAWVAPTAEDEPLEISAVEIPDVVDTMLRNCWEESNGSGFSAANGSGSASSAMKEGAGKNITTKKKKKKGGAKNIILYSKYADYKTLVLQVLSRDIRSVTQRVKVPAREQKADAGTGALPALSSAAADSSAGGEARGGNIEEEEGKSEGKWHVELDGVDITYEVLLNEIGEKRVLVKSAACI